MKLFYCLFKILVVCLALSSSLLSHAQEDTKMEQFDIETFNRNKDKYIWLQTLPDGTEIIQRESHGDGYLVETTPPHSACTNIKLFNYEGKLSGTAQRFFSMHVGVIKEYDDQGNIIKKHDQDKEFTFSVDDLAKKMQDEYGVNIKDTRQVFSVARGPIIIVGQEVPVYDLYVYDHAANRTTAYLVHGSTGELLHTMPAGLEGSPSIMRTYEKLTEQNKITP